MKIHKYLFFLLLSLFQCNPHSDINYVVKPKYEQIRDFSEGYAAIQKDGKWGFIDSTGREVIERQYLLVSSFKRGLATVVNEKDKWGCIDYTGKIIIPLAYDFIDIQHNLGSFVIVFEMGMNGNIYEAKKAGLLNLQGESLTPFKYEDIDYNRSLSQQKVLFLEYTIDGKWGLLSFEGKEICPPKYDFIQGFQGDFTCVWVDGKVTYINKKGEEITPLKYGSFFGNNESHFYMNPGFSEEGLAVVSVAIPSRYTDFYDFVYGYIDTTGKEVIPIQYDQASSFSEGVARVSKVGKGYGFIDKSGKEIIPLKFSSANFPEEGFITVEIKDRKWGLFNTKGKEIVPPKYRDISDFQEGRAAILSESYQWGFINEKGEEVIPTQYDKVESFQYGYARVQKEKDTLKYWGVIDKIGKEVIPCEYEEINIQKNGLICCKRRGKWSLMNVKGGQLTPFKYDKMGYFGDTDLAKVTVYVPAVKEKPTIRFDTREGVFNTHISYIDTLGNEIFPIHHYGGDRFFKKES